MKRGILWTVALGILVVGLAAGPDLWAAPGQNLVRQTVPTRTPQPPLTEPPSPPPTEPPSPPADQPTADPNAAVNATFDDGASDPSLPQAGGWSIHLRLGAAMIVVGFVALALARRRG
jgi:hypothetical protein